MHSLSVVSHNTGHHHQQGGAGVGGGAVSPQQLPLGSAQIVFHSESRATCPRRPDPLTPFIPGCQMSLSSGGTLSMLSISSRAPATSWVLGLYAPSDWRFFRAVSATKVKPMMTINTQKQSSGMATTNQGTPCLWACFCDRIRGAEGEERSRLQVLDNRNHTDVERAHGASGCRSNVCRTRPAVFV